MNLPTSFKTFFKLLSKKSLAKRSSSMAGSSKTKRSSKKTKTMDAEQSRTVAETTIINARLQQIAGQRRVQCIQIRELPTKKLGDNSIVSPRSLDMNIYAHVKLLGIKSLLHQDWEVIYTISKREVYVPLVKEFFIVQELIHKKS